MGAIMSSQKPLSAYFACLLVSRMALKQSDKAEVKQLAHSIIKAQKAEIVRYKRLLTHVS